MFFLNLTITLFFRRKERKYWVMPLVNNMGQALIDRPTFSLQGSAKKKEASQLNLAHCNNTVITVKVYQIET